MRLIYDGDCGFCTKSAMFGKERLKKDVEILPWQSIEDLSVYGIDQTDVQQRAYFVDNDDLVFGGASGVLRFAKNMKFPWPIIARLLLLPGIAFFSELVYRFVARNRHVMPGSTRDCEIEPMSKMRKRFGGLNIHLRSNITKKLNDQTVRYSSSELSYEEVGKSLDVLPPGYNHDRYVEVIGNGKQDFDLAIKGFECWVCQSNSGLLVPTLDLALEVGTTIYFGLKMGPIVLGFPDRIVYRKVADTRYDYAYGTVQGHPETGEELFRLDLRDNGDVVFTIICFSRVVAPLAKLAYPISRFLQKRISRKYIESLETYVAQNRSGNEL